MRPLEIADRIPDWDLQKVMHWEEWKNRNKHFPDSSSLDVGIDNVGIRLDGSLVAIQCKARSSGADLMVKDLGSFAMSTGDDKWSELWVITNTRFSRGVREAILRSESRPLKLVDFIEPVRALALQESIGVKEDNQLALM